VLFSTIVQTSYNTVRVQSSKWIMIGDTTVRLQISVNVNRTNKCGDGE